MEEFWKEIDEAVKREEVWRNRELIPDAVMLRCPVCAEEKPFRFVGWDGLYYCTECGMVIHR